MDVFSVNSTPVSTILESSQQTPQQNATRSEQETPTTQPENTQQAATTPDSRVGSRINVVV